MNKTKKHFLTHCVVIVTSLLGVLSLFPSMASAQSPPPSVLDHIEITPAGGINFYKEASKQTRILAISPAGSLIAGGVSKRYEAPFTNNPPTVNPLEYDESTYGRHWIHDFYFARLPHNQGPPRLHTRGLFLWGRGDSPDIQLGRIGVPDRNTDGSPAHSYGPPTDTPVNSVLGKIVFKTWGAGEFQGETAGITARNDTIATSLANPGSLHFHTAGETTFTDPVMKANARKNGPTRVVIKSNGYVGIGDDHLNPTERLHVQGKILADGNIKTQQDLEVSGNIYARTNLTVSGNLSCTGTKNFFIDHPTKEGKKLVHAAIEGPEAAVYYRGEAQLVNGRAEINLPDYFEALVRKGDRTVVLTNMDGFERLAVERQAGVPVKDGKFVVVSKNEGSSQAFCWEVKAVRTDIAPLLVEQDAPPLHAER